MTNASASLSSKRPPWRPEGTRRSWGGRKEVGSLLLDLAAANAADFERLALGYLHLALAAPGQRLAKDAFRATGGGYLVRAGEAAHPVFVQPVRFEGQSEALGNAEVHHCREAIARFSEGAVQAEAYLLVHNLDPRSPVFREGLGRELEALRSSGRVGHALTWDGRDLLEAAFDGLFDFILARARSGSLSVGSVENALADREDLLTQVPLQVSWLTADQQLLAAGEEFEAKTVADPAALLLDSKPTERTLLLGSFGFGKTTAVARSLLRQDFQVLYVPGAAITQDVAGSKTLLSRCLNAEPLFADYPPEERKTYERILRSVAEHMFKDPSLPLALVIDGLDESPFLCRKAGLAHLLNTLEPVRVPVVLAMRSEYWLSRRGDLQPTAGKREIRGEPRIRRVRKLNLLPWREEEILLFVQRFRDTCTDPAELERLARLEALVADGRFEEIYGDIPRRPLFLRLIAESATAIGLPSERIGRARLFRDWALWKIRRDLQVDRPHLRFEGEPTEDVVETAWEAMLWAAGSMTKLDEEGKLEMLPEYPFDQLRTATPRLERLDDVLALSLQSLLVLSRARIGERLPCISFAHRAFQEFFLAWFLAENHRDRDWPLPETVEEWIVDLRQEGLVDPEARREAERPPGLPPRPTRPNAWEPTKLASTSRKPAPEPDLTLHVLERPGGRRKLFELLLTARDPGLGFNQHPFGIVGLEASPEVFFRHHFKEVEEQGGVRSLGAYLSAQLLRPDLRKTLSGLRHRGKTLQIISADPWIPWEILRIEDSPESREVDGPCLAEAFALTRWLPSKRQTGYLPLSRMAAVVPRDSGLDHAEDEWQDLERLAANGRQVERIPARLHEIEKAFRSGVYDGWHFTSHGFFQESAPDLSAIWLEGNEKLTPVHLGAEASRMGVAHPLVFLNACHTGQSGLSLTGVGGWAFQFVSARAGAFLGTLWPIRDSRSRDFARAFYSGFLGGLPLGEAVRAARQAIRSETDPTWLAYTVFGNPLAVCRPVPGT